MTVILLRISWLLYAFAAAAYVFHFVRPRHVRAATGGYALLATAFVVHVLSIGWGCAEFGGWEFFNLRGGLGMIGWLAAGGLLVLLRLYPMPGLAAFMLPLVLVALLPGFFGAIGSRPGALPEEVRRPAVTVHISVAAGSVALFAIAFGVALMYLLQEREVKGKRFGALFSRLPSLDALDRLNQRLVRAGFVVFTVALLAGTLNAAVVWKGAWSWDPPQIISVLVWFLYGAMVQLRHRGWHGRRYALLTLVGFVVLAGAMGTLRALPGATRHAGNYGGVAATTGGAQ